MNHTLCTYSKTELFQSNVLPTCPLKLNQTIGKTCPCRKRVYLPGDLRVLACNFPKTWNDRDIYDADRFSAALIRKHQEKLAAKPKKGRKKKENRIMSESEDPAVVTEDRIQRPTLHTAVTSLPSVWSKVTDVVGFIINFGKILTESKMFGCNNVAQGQVLAAACLFENRNPVELARVYHIIGGRLSMRADAMLAEFEARGNKQKMVKREDDYAEIELTKGRDKFNFKLSWDEIKNETYVYTKEANDGKVPKKIKLGTATIVNPVALKENWSTPRRRRQMIWARLVSDAISVVDPGVKAGYYTPEELEGGEAIDVDWKPADPVHRGLWEQAKTQGVAETTAVAPVKKEPVPATSADAPFNSEPERKPETEPAGEKPADNTTTKLTVDKPEPPTKKDLLTRLKELKTSLIEKGKYSEELYKKFLEGKGVTTALALDTEQLATAVNRLEQFHKRLELEAEGKAWAEKQLGVEGERKN